MNENDTDEAVETRPCAYCGRPVPQRAAAGRPFRYCRDNDGECQRASRNVRMRHRTSPGMAGQVARTWEIVDRLDQAVETLTESLHSELSPAGVDRRVAEVRAETSEQVAAAHTERDDARRDADKAESAAADAHRLAAAATAERDEARQHATESERRATTATQAATDAQTARDEARRQATAAAALRERAESDRDAAADQLTAAREELATVRAELQEARRERESTERDLAAALRDAQTTAERADELRQERDTAREQTRHAESALTLAEREAAEQVETTTKTLADVRRDAAAAHALIETDLSRAREQATAAASERDALRRTREDLERAVDRAAQDRSDLERRLATALADAEAAQSRAAQLSTQVSDLASALASLGPSRPAIPPQQPEAAGAPG
jgi:hypothetical protein